MQPSLIVSASLLATHTPTPTIVSYPAFYAKDSKCSPGDVYVSYEINDHACHEIGYKDKSCQLFHNGGSYSTECSNAIGAHSWINREDECTYYSDGSCKDPVVVNIPAKGAERGCNSVAEYKGKTETVWSFKC